MAVFFQNRHENSENKKVHFFIAGFGFSGSSSISYYLSLHPEICLSIPKETNYFLPDEMCKLKNVLSWQQYENSFSHAKDDQILGDASIFYIHSSEAIHNIYNYNNHAKFITLLRNPVEKIFASYTQLLFTGNENTSSFKEDWDLQEERLKTENFPRFCRDPIQLLYRERAFMGKAVKKLLQIVPINQVLFISFDDICNNTEEVYLNIQKFLCVSHFRLREYPVVNYRALQKNKVSKYIYPYLRRNRFFMNIVYNSLRTIKRIGLAEIQEANRLFKKRCIEKPKMDPYLRKQIFNELEDDIKLLETLTNIDLSHWR